MPNRTVTSIVGVSAALLGALSVLGLVLGNVWQYNKIKTAGEELKATRQTLEAVRNTNAALRDESSKVATMYRDIQERLNLERLRASQRVSELEEALESLEGREWGMQSIPEDVLKTLQVIE